MAALKPSKVPEAVKRSTLDKDLEAWLKHGCPSLGGHMSVADMRREHQTLVPESKADVQVNTAHTCKAAYLPGCKSAFAFAWDSNSLCEYCSKSVCEYC